MTGQAHPPAPSPLSKADAHIHAVRFLASSCGPALSPHSQGLIRLVCSEAHALVLRLRVREHMDTVRHSCKELHSGKEGRREGGREGGREGRRETLTR